MHTPVNASRKQILQPPTKVLLSDISLVTPDLPHYPAAARRLAAHGRPAPGRAWYAHRSGDTPCLICDALSDEERALAGDKAPTSVERQDRSFDSETEWISESSKLPSRELTKLYRGGPLSAISVAQIQTDSRAKWSLQTWWKNQLPRRDSRGCMQFGSAETPRQAEERKLINSTKKIRKDQAADRNREMAVGNRLKAQESAAERKLKA